MKEKIVGIFVCMLLIATAVPTVTSVKMSAINATVPSCPLKSMGGSWTETQKIIVSDAKKENFGCGVSVDGDTALIGAPGDHGNNGSVYVYTHNGTTWTQQQKLTASDPGVDDSFGYYVSLYGDTALIGAPDWVSKDSSGAAYVFTRTGTTWAQQQKLTPSDGAAGDFFGFWVSLNGDTALIGAPGKNSNTGSAYVFTRTGTTWTQQAKLLASDGKTGYCFGQGVSLSGDTALIGRWAWWNSTTDPGSAYVFTRTGTIWTQQAELVGSDSRPGDSFGDYVFLNGDTVLVSAPNADFNGQYSGTVYAFTRNGTTWTQQAELLASDGSQGAGFGTCLSLEVNTALIGAAGDSTNGAGEGSAYIFTRTGTTWTQQQKLTASDSKPKDHFGWPGCLNNNTAFIATSVDNTGSPSGPNTNSVYVFTKTTVGLTYSITGGLGVHLKITNNGNATSVPWKIHVKGGILGRINTTVNGTIDIPAGGTKTVGTGMLFGFGALSITATVADEQKTAKGTQIIIFSKVK